MPTFLQLLTSTLFQPLSFVVFLFEQFIKIFPENYQICDKHNGYCLSRAYNKPVFSYIIYILNNPIGYRENNETGRK